MISIFLNITNCIPLCSNCTQTSNLYFSSNCIFINLISQTELFLLCLSFLQCTMFNFYCSCCLVTIGSLTVSPIEFNVAFSSSVRHSVFVFIHLLRCDIKKGWYLEKHFTTFSFLHSDDTFLYSLLTSCLIYVFGVKHFQCDGIASLEIHSGFQSKM